MRLEQKTAGGPDKIYRRRRHNTEMAEKPAPESAAPAAAAPAVEDDGDIVRIRLCFLFSVLFCFSQLFSSVPGSFYSGLESAPSSPQRSAEPLRWTYECASDSYRLTRGMSRLVTTVVLITTN